MTAFDHRYYNKENLKQRDRAELDFWFDEIMNAIASVELDYDPFDEEPDEQPVLQRIRSEVAAEVFDDLREAIGWRFDDIVIGTIDNYEEDVPEVKDFTTYSMDIDGSSAEDDPMEIFRRIRENQPKFTADDADHTESDEEEKLVS